MSDDSVAEPEAWVDRHGDVLYRYALLRLRSPELAADVVQETFLEGLARLRFIRGAFDRTDMADWDLAPQDRRSAS